MAQNKLKVRGGAGNRTRLRDDLAWQKSANDSVTAPWIPGATYCADVVRPVPQDSVPEKAVGARLRTGKRTHGLTANGKKNGPPEYSVWLMMKQRCLNPRSAKFRLYGARGIRICDRWRDSFVDFIADVGPRPGPGYSIERIDNNGHYEPSNCKWATAKEQSANRRPRSEWQRAS